MVAAQQLGQNDENQSFLQLPMSDETNQRDSQVVRQGLQENRSLSSLKASPTVPQGQGWFGEILLVQFRYKNKPIVFRAVQVRALLLTETWRENKAILSTRF